VVRKTENVTVKVTEFVAGGKRIVLEMADASKSNKRRAMAGNRVGQRKY
jgi:hypothetical protein